MSDKVLGLGSLSEGRRASRPVFSASDGPHGFIKSPFSLLFSGRALGIINPEEKELCSVAWFSGKKNNLLRVCVREDCKEG